MAKKQKPSGDLPDDGAEVTAATVPESIIDALPVSARIEPEAIVAPLVAEPHERIVELLDESRVVFDRVIVHKTVKQFTHDKKIWRHVSNASDGSWQFMV